MVRFCTFYSANMVYNTIYRHNVKKVNLLVIFLNIWLFLKCSKKFCLVQGRTMTAMTICNKWRKDLTQMWNCRGNGKLECVQQPSLQEVLWLCNTKKLFSSTRKHRIFYITVVLNEYRTLFFKWEKTRHSFTLFVCECVCVRVCHVKCFCKI